MSPTGNAATYTQVGNPIDLGTGNKLQTESDYHSGRPAGLHFVRYYNSVLGAADTGLGRGWRHSYQRSLAIDPAQPDAVTVWRDDGSQYHCTQRDGAWQPPLGIVEQLTAIEDADGSRTGWTYTTADGQVEHYDATGRLLRLDHPLGAVQQLHYDSDGRLLWIADSRGEQLLLQWRGTHLHRVTTPDGDRLAYDYDERLNLVDVIHRSAGLRGLFASLRTPERRYHYNDARHPHALTGMDDATGQRFATWRYDDLGRAISSEHGDGAEKITLDYRSPVDPDARQRRVTVTNALGHRATYTLEPARPGKWRLRSIDGAPAIDCVAVQQQHRYDDRGFLALQYGDGIASHYRRDARGRLIDEQHGLRIDRAENLRSAPGAVRIERRWQPERPWPTRETHTSWQIDDRHPQGHWQPVRQSDYRHDKRGRLTLASHRDLLPTEMASSGEPSDKARDWQYAYTFADAERTRLVEHRITDPRGHTTVYIYDDNERLQTITNALNQTTRFSAYNHRGQPERIDLPDGQQLHLTYNAHGLPTRLVRTGGALTATTTVDYDAAGRLIHLKRPDGSEQRFAHNAAGQLTGITNGWGERIELTPNALHGQWQQLQLLAADSHLHQQHHRRLNARGQLVALEGNAGQQTAIDYDPRGNPIRLRQGHEDPAQAELTRTNRAGYDTLGRLLAWTDAANHTTHFQYDPAGPLATVTDANGNTTRYQRNGFGEVIGERSPASGGVVQRFDAMGNLIERRADGAPSESVIHFRYDALNRLTQVDYPGEIDDITYTYDQTGPEYGNGTGRLTRIETATQALDYRYDTLGRRIAETTQEKDTEGKTTHTTTLTYRYDKNSRLTAIGYPDGSEARYHYDRERIIKVSYIESATRSTTTLLSSIAYAPFGGPVQWTYGNGLTQTKTLDWDGRVTEISVQLKHRGLLQSGPDMSGSPVWSQRYDYDLYQNIERLTIDDTTHRYGYDAVDRLVKEVGEENRIGYAYDPVGNRLREQRNGTTIDYQYGPGNRLLKRDDMEVLIDDRGNLLAETSPTNAVQDAAPGHSRRFDYNSRNRPTAFYTSDKLTARYDCSPLGLRIGKTVYSEKGEQHTRFSYAPDTRLLAEQSDTRTVHYVWLGSQPVAVIEKDRSKGKDRRTASRLAIHYPHPDHLGTPRVATDNAKRIVWRWHSDAFGTTLENTDPDGDGEHIHIALRFPGQYRDEESGLYYNVFRYYDPAIGRYTQSDPIGLEGGINIYSYAYGNPLYFSDPLGLAVYLSYHEVAVGGGGGFGTGHNHLAVLIIPDDQGSAALEAEKNGRFLLGGSDAGIAANKYYTTISAGPNDSIPFPGNLQSTPNRVGDEPWSNFTAKKVSPPVYSNSSQCRAASDKEFINNLLLAESGYKPVFKYEFFPTSESEGYNSNSFAIGVLSAVGASPEIPRGSFPGADKMVPAWGFGFIPEAQGQVEEDINFSPLRRSIGTEEFE